MTFGKEMKTTIVASALFGSILGASSTYLVLGSGNDPIEKVVDRSGIDTNPDIRAESEDNDTFADNEDDPDDHYRFLLTDPTDLTQRDICVALWYAYQNQTNDILAETTGHKFGLVGNRRTPVEILEEQLAFWREFQAESTRLALEQSLNRTNESKKQNKSEQATPRKSSD